jgi:hypothetical protein
VGAALTALAAALGAFLPADAGAEWGNTLVRGITGSPNDLIAKTGVNSSLNDRVAGVRVILCVIGMIIAGAAVTMRPRWFAAWLIAAIASGLAGFGFPATWDSFRLVAFVFAGLAAAGAAIAATPPGWRILPISVAVLYHFSGIFSAVTNPPPSPFMTQQSWTLFFRPYLQFAYLNNAYQFYSPDPGPASEVWFCIEYETLRGDPVQVEAPARVRELQPLLNADGSPRRDDQGKPIQVQKTDSAGHPVYKQVIGSDGNPVVDESGEPVYVVERDAKGAPRSYEPLTDGNGSPVYRALFDAQGNPTYLDDPANKDAYGYLKFKPHLDPDQKPINRKTFAWIKIPRRLPHFKDPLGQAYYRRLSLTENVSHGFAISQLLPKDQAELAQRRKLRSDIPTYENELPLVQQYLMPYDGIHVLLPAFVRHIAHDNQRKDRAVVGIKVYRVLHNIVDPRFFVGGDWEGAPTRLYPYEMTTYRPYFLGDFNARGELRDLSDPMLYWLVPIVRNPSATPQDFANMPKKMTLAEYRKRYDDWVMVHSGSNHMEAELDK